MNWIDWLPDIIKLGIGFPASFLAVWVWGKTRDIAWIMVLLGALVLYFGHIFQVLERVGILSYDQWLGEGLSLIEILFSLVPFLFFAMGFLFFLLKNRRY